MKKVYLMIIAFCMVMLTACADESDGVSDYVPGPDEKLQSSDMNQYESESESETEKETEDETELETEASGPTVAVPIIGIYCNTVEGDRPLVTTWDEPWVEKKDIAEFGIFPTNEPTLPNTTLRDIWSPLWEAYEGWEACKIGYKLEIKLKTGWEYSKIIKNPDDVNRFMEYIEVYMYDDIHQIPGNWYSHLLMEEIDEETVITSFKLTAGSAYEEVEHIRLTAFVYDSEDDFDEKGEYIGPVSYTIDVVNGAEQ